MFVFICFMFQIDASFSHLFFIFIYSCVLFTTCWPFSCLRDWIGLSAAPANHHHNDSFRGPLCHPQSPPRLLLRLTPRHHQHFSRVLIIFISIEFGTFHFIFSFSFYLWYQCSHFYLFSFKVPPRTHKLFFIINLCKLSATCRRFRPVGDWIGLSSASARHHHHHRRHSPLRHSRLTGYSCVLPPPPRLLFALGCHCRRFPCWVDFHHEFR